MLWLETCLTIPGEPLESSHSSASALDTLRHRRLCLKADEMVGRLGVMTAARVAETRTAEGAARGKQHIRLCLPFDCS
jgi:hypothetical protein